MAAEGNLHSEHVLGHEAGVHVLQTPQRLNQQSRPYQQR